MSIILDTSTQSTMKSVQYNGRKDPGGYVNILMYLCFKVQPVFV